VHDHHSGRGPRQIQVRGLCPRPGWLKGRRRVRVIFYGAGRKCGQSFASPGDGFDTNELLGAASGRNCEVNANGVVNGQESRVRWETPKRREKNVLQERFAPWP